MDTNIKVEYLVLIILAISYYFYSYKRDLKDRKNREYINKNLSVGNKIITKSGIIGEIVSIEDSTCTIVSGDQKNFSYFKITKVSIDKIIEA